MSQIAQQSTSPPPTLFQLESLPVQPVLGPAFRRPRRVSRGQIQSPTIRSPGGTERLLRFDSPQPDQAVHVADVPNTERRLERLTGRQSQEMEVESPGEFSVDTVQLADTATEWFHDHASDLISGLGLWSMKLDRRESDLDRREHELNRRSRFLRQHQCVE